jgi:Protein of unknown function (DUF1559)
MKAIISVLSFAILWFTYSSSGLCLQNSTPPGSIGDDPPSTSRTLDDIRSELKKKNSQIGGMMGMGSSGMMGSGGSMGMGSMMGGAGMGAPGGMGAGEGSSGMGYGGGDMGGMGMGGMGMAVPTEKQLLAQLIQQLRGRLGSKKFNRDKVEKQLRSALQQYFDADIEERVKEFDKVKARVIEMEAKLQRRLDSESEIVELQLKQMLHKADGLDFNVPSGSDVGMGPGMGGYGGMGGDAGGGAMSGGEGYPGAGVGDMGGMGMGGPGMAMGSGMGMSSGYGEGMGVDLTVLGYDSSFGLTRLQRLDPNELDDSDPLRLYAQANKLAEGAKTADSDTEKMSALLSALHLFEARFHHFPRTANRQTKSQPPHSWRVAILPLIGHGDLYKEYQFDQPWDSQQNLEVAKKMPELYRTSAKKNSTSFMMIVDGGSFDSSNTPARMMDISDGTSNTIALILSDQEVAWTKPYADVIYSGNSPVPGLSKSRLVGMADGTTRTLPKIDDSVFRALITRGGGEPVKLDDGAKQ